MTARIGLVGVGWWAAFKHIPELVASPHADLVAICDLDAERVRIAADRFGIVGRYVNVADMLAAENLDGVVIATPHIHHTAPAIAALEAGAHVLIEKPMATTAADGRLIAATAKRVGREVMVPTGLNFTHYSRRAAEWVRAGRVGEVRHVVCQMGSPLDDLMAGKPMVETTEHMFRPPASTWADPKKAGGYGWGQMSHSLAWLVYVTDLAFESVYCMDVKSPAGVDYYDAAVARATNGASISIAGSSTVPKHVGMHTDVRIYGTEGMIHFSNLPARLELRRHDGQDDAVPMTDFEGLYEGGLPVRVFAQMCDGQLVENASNGECGARVTEAIDALYRSAASGQLARIGG